MLRHEGPFEPIEPLYDAVRRAKGLGNPTGPVRALLDAETAPDMCQLLCNNCHHCKTNGYPRLPKCVPCAPADPGLSAEDAAFKAAWDSDDNEL